MNVKSIKDILQDQGGTSSGLAANANEDVFLHSMKDAGGNWKSAAVTYQGLYDDLYTKIKTQLESEGWGKQMTINSTNGFFTEPSMSISLSANVPTKIPFPFMIFESTKIKRPTDYSPPSPYDKLMINGVQYSSYARLFPSDHMSQFNAYTSDTYITYECCKIFKTNSELLSPFAATITIYPLVNDDGESESTTITITRDDILNNRYPDELIDAVPNISTALTIKLSENLGHLFKSINISKPQIASRHRVTVSPTYTGFAYYYSANGGRSGSTTLSAKSTLLTSTINTNIYVAPTVYYFNLGEGPYNVRFNIYKF